MARKILVVVAVVGALFGVLFGFLGKVSAEDTPIAWYAMADAEGYIGDYIPVYDDPATICDVYITSGSSWTTTNVIVTYQAGFASSGLEQEYLEEFYGRSNLTSQGEVGGAGFYRMLSFRDGVLCIGSGEDDLVAHIQHETNPRETFVVSPTFPAEAPHPIVISGETPVEVSIPLTLTVEYSETTEQVLGVSWAAEGMPTITTSLEGNVRAVFAWEEAGTFVVTATAEFLGGNSVATTTVEVETGLHYVYLPLVSKPAIACPQISSEDSAGNPLLATVRLDGEACPSIVVYDIDHVGECDAFLAAPGWQTHTVELFEGGAFAVNGVSFSYEGSDFGRSILYAADEGLYSALMLKDAGLCIGNDLSQVLADRREATGNDGRPEIRIYPE